MHSSLSFLFGQILALFQDDDVPVLNLSDTALSEHRPGTFESLKTSEKWAVIQTPRTSLLKSASLSIKM